MSKLNKVLLALVAIVLIAAGFTWYGIKHRKAALLQDHSLTGDNAAVITKSGTLVKGFPTTLLLIKGAQVVSSQKNVNKYGLSQYSAIFHTKQSIHEVLVTYMNYFQKNKVNTKNLMESTTNASFNTSSSTSSIRFSANISPDNKTTEYLVEVLVQE